MPYRIGILSTHPIQYYSPWYRALAAREDIDLQVYYAHQQTAEGQALAGFGVAFEWDVPLLDGYPYKFLQNVARRPNVCDYWGCDTPGIAEHIERERFDAFIVHGWYNRSFWRAMRACWRTRTPLLIRGDSQLLTSHSLVRRLVKRWYYSRFIPRFDAYLVVGARAREYYLAFGAKAERMFFAPHFVDNDFFAAAADRLQGRRDELRRQLGIDESAVVFLFAGKYIAKKRPLDFVDAVHRAARSTPRIVGVMVGDGPLRSEIEARSAALRAPIHMCGFMNQSKISEAYMLANMLALPSDCGETWGLVVNEAMASGLPAMVSDQVGCTPDLVHNGRTGYVYTCGDVEQLAQLMVFAAGHPQDVQSCANAARDLIHRYSVAEAVRGTCAAVAAVAQRWRSATGLVAQAPQVEGS